MPQRPSKALMILPAATEPERGKPLTDTTCANEVERKRRENQKGGG